MQDNVTSAHGSDSFEPFWRLLYRYIWPFQYFRDVTCGSKLQRQQNYRYNRAMRIYLPGFVLKWALITACCFLLGGFFERGAALVIPAAASFVTGAWTLSVAVLLSVSYLWLERFPELYGPAD